jgi:hypothetical protein
MEIKEGGNRFREELYTCALKASFSEAAFTGDISISETSAAGLLLCTR